MDNCPYMYVERDGNASITMCSLHPNEIWGVDERTCMRCPNADPKWSEWKLSLEENNSMDEYKGLVERLRYLAKVYSICENENTNEYKLAVEAADAIEYLMRKLEAREVALASVSGCLGDSTNATTDVLDTTEDRIT